MRTLAALALVLLVRTPVVAQPHAGYYRQPSIGGQTIVFVAEGDLWKVPVSGGVATRLTSHPGDEFAPRLSPDGTLVAFAAEYEGPTEVYVMPVAGGPPKRLTWDGQSRGVSVVGWKSEAEGRPARVLASTNRFSTLPNTQLTLLDPSTGARELIPLDQAAQGVFAESGVLYFTRLAFQGSHTKRYRGGTAQNLWSFDGTREAVPLTPDFPGTSANAMWWGGRVYFLSDRDGTMEVWSCAPDGSGARQHTNHAAEPDRLLDVRGASLDASGRTGRIVYQFGADLRLFDVATGLETPVPVTLDSDFDQTREKWIKKPLEYLTSAHLSPSGDRVVMVARGQVFVASKEPGRLVEVARDAGVRHRGARFSPDGKSLVLLSDASGEVEVWKAPANGVGESTRVTRDGRVLRWDALPSPDGARLAVHDKNQELWVYDATTGEGVKVANDPFENFGALSWSPDSRYLAFTVYTANQNRVAKIYDAQDRATLDATTDRFDTSEAAWSPDGKWLYLLSDRHISTVVPSPWGALQPEPFFDRKTRVYALALKADARSPWQAPDELFRAKEAEKKPEDKAPGTAKPDDPKPEPKKPTPVEIDREGLAARLVQTPIAPGNYAGLGVGEKRIYLTTISSEPDSKPALGAVDIGHKETDVKVLVKDIEGHELSADGKSLLIRKKDSLAILAADAGKDADLSKAGINLDGWTFPLVPREQWRQMFAEAWRLERDYFYDRGMHGVDWPAMLERYRPLVDRVATRAELSDVLSQMVGELSALHIFVYGGDERNGDDAIAVASLGALLEPDPAGWRVARVFAHDPDEPDKASPLARPGVGVVAGDVIVRFNGRATAGVEPGQLLRAQAGRQVLLGVRPGEGEARDVVVTPIAPAAEEDLRYHEWEYARRRRVEQEGAGDLGYVHLRAMGAENMNEFARGYYPVFHRKGLIIDVRHNRGGNIDSWILSRLLRKAWFFWLPRVGEPFWNMQQAFRGHVVVLCNERTASDGEAFSEGVKRLKIGTVLGTRTWGGEIWLSSSNFLVDGGIATAAEIGVYGPEGEWLIEGHGVEPDVAIDNPPHATFKGEDAQLAAAIELLKKRIAEQPVDVPPPPDHPDKSLPGPGGNRPR